jgi:hypothetical protein
VIPIQFVFVAAGFSLVGIATYVADTLRGRSHPNRVTWFLWALAPLIAFVAQIQQGVGLQALLTFMVGFGPALVFVASFVGGHAPVRITRFDLACASVSVLALLAWQATGKGNVAIAFSLLADFMAAVPTLRKAYVAPHTETWAAFACSAISAALTLLTITHWNFATACFPAYILVMSLVLAVLVGFPGLRLRPRATPAGGPEPAQA